MARHYPHLLDPRIYPDDARRCVKVPSWETFGNVTQFTALRDLGVTAWREELDRYTVEFKLGRVVWPLIQLLYTPHVSEVIEEIRKRGLYLFDLWSIVPGSPMDGIWSNITPPPGMVPHLQRVLGDRFLGIDNGEQDGRYVWATGEQQCPSAQSRYSQYLSFQAHFQKLCDELGNRMTALVSLCFGHYFLKEGNHFLLGAETAQALPSSQLYYSFIRGAGRQYGVPWFGNASVFNRWGWKDYGPQKRDHHYVSGPDQGSSLSLLKRLLYTHYLYNSVAIGFESGWMVPVEKAQFALTPIGRIQRGAVDFVERNGTPGVMHAPIALLLDFFAGWTPPRHLYTPKVYQVWGGMPFDSGDYLMHGVFSLLYPGYEDASYYHDERGFLSATPFGDMADCVLSDVPPWVLQQYGLVIAAGALSPSRETADKLRGFVAAGGHLVVTAANARGLLPDLDLSDRPIRIPAGSEVRWTSGPKDVEQPEFDLFTAKLPPGSQVLASQGKSPCVARIPHGKGRVTLLLSPFGLNALPAVHGPIPNEVDTPLPCPFQLLSHVRRAIGEAASEQRLFSVGEGLGYVTCRKSAGVYTLGIHNNGLSARPFAITSHCGRLKAATELALDQSEKGAVGYWPKEFAANDGGRNGPGTIAGGEVRLFRVEVEEEGVECLSRSAPPARPKDRYLGIRFSRAIQEEILARPTFFQHFDGVKVEWTYLRDRDRARLDQERGWLERQKVRVMVDFSRGMNLFPGLTLLDAYAPDFEQSKREIDGVLEKMTSCGAADMIVSLHRKPENHWSDEQAREEYLRQLRDLCARAARHGVAVHLQAHPVRWTGKSADVLALIEEAACPNLRFALNTGHALMEGPSIADALERAGKLLGAILVSAPASDVFGQSYDAHAPAYPRAEELRGLARAAEAPIALDAVYADADEEYLDISAVEAARARP